MSDQQKAVPRGRGALLLEALKKAQQKPGDGAGEEAPPQPDPPKSRGRAALLQKLTELRQSKSVGSTSTSSPVDATATVTESLATTTLSEPCLYQGTSGSTITAACNYIKLKMEQDRGVFEYAVQFSPQVDAKSVRSRLVSEYVGRIRMFDGGSCLYIPKKLPEDHTEVTLKHPIDSSEVTMTLLFVKNKRLGECLHLFNILFKRIMQALLFSRVGRNYFDPHHTRLIPQHKLEVLPGYAVAVDEYEGGVMVCLDTQHRVMRTENVLDALINLRLMAKQQFKEAAFKTLVGTTVLTRYNNKTYKIDDVLWDSTPTATFETHDGRSISYIQYYKSQYNIDIKDVAQPLLLNKQTRKGQNAEEVDRYICLVPELCYLTGLTDEMRADFKVMKDVSMYTRVTPNQRSNALRTFLDNIDNTPAAKQILSNWGLTIDNGTMDLLARVLQPELILFGDGVRDSSEKADWNALVCKNKVLGPIDLKNWYVFYTVRDERYATEFGQTMVRLGGPMGMRIDKPQFYKLKDDRTDTYVTALKQLNMTDIQILVFICPVARDDRYAAIKRLCCVHMPIPTQVINSRTLSNPQKVRSITQKIALQMNCKLGGTLWSLRFPIKNWMICGIDIYHNFGKNQSVCAFISSLNEDITRWFSTVVFQDKELGDQYKTAFIKALEKYREINGVFPSNVVIFRDGVGDGQLKSCKEYEVAQFESCLRDYSIDNVKLTVVVVQKRINTRIFLKKSTDNFENPMPGCVLDHTITRRNWYDFFLVAQNVRQGTVTPTHYIVVHDTGKLRPDHVQKLAYKLCHLYYNWPGTIRVPAPCQYAHKLAYLVGEHLKKQPSIKLSDVLYYL
ncbi:hypothetical protein FQR65_LT02396 [Abscondita terminalis]|nr:hypothetical protein FQR65_LT02396 [Abscondita terminalis]